MKMFFQTVTNLQKIYNVFIEKSSCVSGPIQFKPMVMLPEVSLLFISKQH